VNILLTGGMGNIGSHAVVKLCNVSHESILLDNFCNIHIQIFGVLKRAKIAIAVTYKRFGEGDMPHFRDYALRRNGFCNCNKQIKS
jgi:UDP-glucose 4-epimerase